MAPGTQKPAGMSINSSQPAAKKRKLATSQSNEQDKTAHIRMLGELSKATSDVSFQIDSVLAKASHVEKTIKELKEENEVLHDKISLMDKKMAERSKEISATRKIIDEQKEEMLGYLQEKTTLHSQICELAWKNSRMENEIKGFRKENEGLKEETASSERNLQAKWTGENHGLRQEIADQRKEIDRLKKVNEAVAAVLAAGTALFVDQPSNSD